jgi:hypothetical protein
VSGSASVADTPQAGGSWDICPGGSRVILLCQVGVAAVQSCSALPSYASACRCRPPDQLLQVGSVQANALLVTTLTGGSGSERVGVRRLCSVASGWFPLSRWRSSLPCWATCSTHRIQQTQFRACALVSTGIEARNCLLLVVHAPGRQGNLVSLLTDHIFNLLGMSEQASALTRS